jgi:hypothetical protein
VFQIGECKSPDIARSRGNPTFRGAVYTKSSRAQACPQACHSCMATHTPSEDYGPRCTLIAALTDSTGSTCGESRHGSTKSNIHAEPNASARLWLRARRTARATRAYDSAYSSCSNVRNIRGSTQSKAACVTENRKYKYGGNSASAVRSSAVCARVWNDY